MKKLSLFLLCLMLIIGAIATVAVSAEDPTAPTDEQLAQKLVVSDGYSARIEEYHGVRAVFELDHALLAELDAAGKDVEIGILIAANIDEDSYATTLVKGAKGVIDDVFYNGDEIVKKYYDTDPDDAKYEFVYAVTFKGGKEQANKNVALAFRAYVTIGSETYYIDQHSGVGTVASLNEVATALVATEENRYPFLQRLVNDLPEAKINDVSIDKYSIYANGNVEAAKALSAAIKKATGYDLPIVGRLDDDCFVIELDETLDSTYKIAVDGAKITITVKNAAFASYAAESIAIAGEKNNYTVSSVEKGAYVYDTLYVGYNAETGSFDNTVIIVDTTKGYFNYVYAKDGANISILDLEDADPYAEFVDGYLKINNYIDLNDIIPQAKGDDGKYTVEFLAKNSPEFADISGDGSTVSHALGVEISIIQRVSNGEPSAIAIKFSGKNASNYQKNPDTRSLYTYSMVMDAIDGGDGTIGEAFVNVVSVNSEPDIVEYNDYYRFHDHDLYNLRVYDYMLSEAEIAQNHFADIARFYELDVSAFVELSATEKQFVYNTFKESVVLDFGANYESGKANAQQILDSAIRTIAYNSIYVTEDALFIIDLTRGDFDYIYIPEGKGLDMPANAIFVEPSVDSNGTLHIGYLDSKYTNKTITPIVLTELFKDESGAFPTEYTVETVSNRYQSSSAGVKPVIDIGVSLMFDISNNSGAFRIRLASDSTNLWSPTTKNSSSATIYGFNRYVHAMTYYVNKSTNSIKLNLNAAAYASNDISVDYATYGAESFQLFTGAETNIYAIRAYSRALTSTEMYQNHFADIAKFFQLDLTDFFQLDDDAKDEVYDAFKKVEFYKDGCPTATGVTDTTENKNAMLAANKASAQALLDATIAPYKHTVTYQYGTITIIGDGDFTLEIPDSDLFLGYYDEAKGEFATNEDGEKLDTYELTGDVTLVAKYVPVYTITYPLGTLTVRQDVQTFKLDIPADDLFLGYFTADGTQVTDKNGNKLDSFTLTGDIEVDAKLVDVYNTLFVGYNAKTNTYDDVYLVADFSTGAINYVYRLEDTIWLEPVGSPAYIKDDLGNTYITFASYIDFEELFNRYTYPTVAEGNEMYTVEFVLQDTKDASSASVTSFYVNLGFETRALQRSPSASTKGFDYYVGGLRAFINGKDPFINGFNNKLTSYSLVFDTKDTDGDGEDGVSASVYYNATAASRSTSASNVITESTFNLVAKPAYRIMASNIKLYEIRVYSRVLYADEVAQNHFADIAKYFQLDVTAFRASDNATKKAVYAAFSGIALSDTNKTDAQMLLDNEIYNVVDYGSGSVTVMGNGDFTLPVPEYDESKYIFLGYYDEAKSELATNEDGEKLDTYEFTGDVTLVAKYVPVYTITYPLGSTTVREDATTFTLEVPANSTFYGYFIDDVQVTDKDGVMVEGFDLAGDIEVVAKYRDPYKALYVGYNVETDSYSDTYIIANVGESGVNYVYRDALIGGDNYGNTSNDRVYFASLEAVYNENNGYYFARCLETAASCYVDVTGVLDKFGYPKAEKYDVGGASFIDHSNEKYTIEFVAKTVSESNNETFSINFGMHHSLNSKRNVLYLTTYSGPDKTGHNLYQEELGYHVFANLTTYSLAIDAKYNGDGVALDMYYGAVGLKRTETALTEDVFALYGELGLAKPDYRWRITAPATAQFYEVRIYQKTLSSVEVAQNHFADVAKYCNLDVSVFHTADEATKLAVYEAFRNVAIFDDDYATSKATSQAILDGICPRVTE